MGKSKEEIVQALYKVADSAKTLKNAARDAAIHDRSQDGGIGRREYYRGYKQTMQRASDAADAKRDAAIHDRSQDGGLDKWEASKLKTDNQARIKKLMNNGKVYNMHDGPIYDRSQDGGLSEEEFEKLLNTQAIRDRSQDGGLSEEEFETPPASIYRGSQDGGLGKKEFGDLKKVTSVQDVINNIVNNIAIRDRSKDGGLSEEELGNLKDAARLRDGGLGEGEFEKLLNTIAIHDRSQDGGLSKGETKVLNNDKNMWLIANLLGSDHPDTIKRRNNNPNWEDPISIDDETGSISFTLGGDVFRRKKN